MYERLKDKILGQMQRAVPPFCDEVGKKTVGEVIDSPFFSQFLTPTARNKICGMPQDDVMPDSVVQSMIERYRRRNNDEFTGYLKRLDCASKYQPPKQFEIQIKFTIDLGSATYRAVAKSANCTKYGQASGTRYTKDATAVSKAINSNLEIMRLFYDHAELGLAFDSSVDYGILNPLPMLRTDISLGVIIKVFKQLGFTYKQTLCEKTGTQNLHFYKEAKQ